MDFPHSSVDKDYICNAGDPGSIPGLGRSSGEGIGYPLQYSGLENSMDCIVHGVAKSQTQLSDFQFQEIVNHFYSSHMIEDLELLEYMFVLLIVIFPNKSKAMNFSNDIKKNQIYSHMYLFQLGKFIFLICSVMICLQCLQTFAPLASNLLHYKRV